MVQQKHDPLAGLTAPPPAEPSAAAPAGAPGRKKREKWLTFFPVSELVLYPETNIPCRVSQPDRVALIEQLWKKQELFYVAAPRRAGQPGSRKEDYYPVGTLVYIRKLIRLSEGEVIALFQGERRARLQVIARRTSQLRVQVSPLSYAPFTVEQTRQVVLLESIKQEALDMLALSGRPAAEVQTIVATAEHPDQFMGYVATQLLPFDARQELLALDTGEQFAEALYAMLRKEHEFLVLQQELREKVRHSINEEQRAFFLRHHLKTLQAELGEEAHGDLEQLDRRAEAQQWPEQVGSHFRKTIEKARRLHPSSMEYGNLLNYAEVLLTTPWQVYATKKSTLHAVEKRLNKDHYGMEQMKKRVSSILAVEQLRQAPQGKILCFSGLPGTGKTSVCYSIAEALGRPCERVFLGGVHDEIVLRGSYKTYIGAALGRLIAAVKKSGVANPVLILDEIDKMDTSRGNPAAVLMEALDPAQNHSFVDNYLEVPFDLSRVLFIGTANDADNIEHALYDRLEVIEFSSYALEEKLEIARRHLLPKVIKEHGLRPDQLTVPLPTVRHIIQHYTYEGGVRELYRQFSLLCGEVAKAVVLGKSYPSPVRPAHLQKLLGTPKYETERYEPIEEPGVAIGLSWTPAGGDILYIEARLFPGEGDITVSGQLGDVMKESASTALTFLRTQAGALHLDERLFTQYDLHIHIPEGAVRKEGPSAGITLFTAIASLYTQRRVKQRLAMTGEITLRNVMLPVGGIREKVLAARRAGIRELILSEKNKRDVADIPARFIRDLTFHYLHKVTPLLDLALEPHPLPGTKPWPLKGEKEVHEK